MTDNINYFTWSDNESAINKQNGQRNGVYRRANKKSNANETCQENYYFWFLKHRDHTWEFSVGLQED